MIESLEVYASGLSVMEGFVMFENEMAEFGNSIPKRCDSKAVEYALELEYVLSRLEHQLHECDNPNEIVVHALETACRFYGGDWAGFLEVDLELSLWTPYLWYSEKMEDYTLDMVGEMESAEFLILWVVAMKENKPVSQKAFQTNREIYG